MKTHLKAITRIEVFFLIAGFSLMWPARSPAQNYGSNYTALYVFGHSREAVGGAPSAGYWQGRFSNGPVWPELLSTNLGFPFLPANDRAVAGAGSADILTQVGSLAPPSNAGSALFFVEVGHMDFFRILSVTNSDTWGNTTAAAVRNWSNSVVECYARGARTLVAPNLVDFAWFPQRIVQAPDPAYVRARTILANAAYKAARMGLASRFPDLRIVPIDEFGFGDLLLTNYPAFGLTNITGWAQGCYQCDASQFFSWDGGHITTKAHALLADVMAVALAGPHLSLVRDGPALHLEASRLIPGTMYRLERSATLGEWEGLGSFLASTGSHYDMVPIGTSAAFYRLSFDQ